MFKVNELLKATPGVLLSGNLTLEVRGVSIDSRKTKEGDLFIAIKGSRFDGHDFIAQAIRKGARAVISAKTIKADMDIAIILVKDTIKALGDIAHFHRQRFSVPIISITGSNGKTTAKDMVSFVLESEFNVLKNEGTQNNQIGLPLTLLRLNKDHDVVVLEMGTNHFGEIRRLSQIACANIGVILNIGPSHLEFLDNLKAVFREKYDLIENLTFPYIAILNKDDRFLNVPLKKNKDKFLISFGIENKSDFRASDIKLHGDRLVFKLNKHNFRLNTLGPFNVYNALASIVIARLFGLDYSTITSRVLRFKFPQGRLNIKRIDRKTFIDDTYNSNPASLSGALDVLKNIKTKARKIVVLGDMLELGPLSRKFHLQAGKQIYKICDIIITAGTLSKSAAWAAERHGFDRDSIFICDSAEEAARTLHNIVRPSGKDIILVKGSRLMRMEEVFKK